MTAAYIRLSAIAHHGRDKPGRDVGGPDVVQDVVHTFGRYDPTCGGMVRNACITWLAK
jgi:hypothetical protein